MLWGATLRSPHPRADIWSIDIAAALAMPGVHAVLTHEDVPGRKTYGMEHPRPAGAGDAATSATRASRSRSSPPTTPRPRAARRPRSRSSTRCSSRSATPRRRWRPARRACTSAATSCATCASTTATPTRPPTSSSPASTRSGCRTRPSSAPSPAWPCPTARAASTSTSRPSGCTSTATSSPRASACRRRRCASRSRGVGGAFGGREDLSMQIHACMLALHTGRPVKIVYNREESFFGHVHRHPCRCATSTARRRTATSSTSARASCSTAARTPRRRPPSSRTRPASPPARTTCPTRASTRYVTYTNNPPCGAMRGFGAVQVAIGHEAQMDKLAAALGMDPVDLRIRNAMKPGSRMPTGQLIPEPAPVAELLERLRAMPLPAEPPARQRPRPARAAGRRVEHDPRRGRRARRRLRRRLQERRLLRGLRRLLDRARAAVASTPASRSSRSTPPPPRSARAS